MINVTTTTTATTNFNNIFTRNYRDSKPIQLRSKSIKSQQFKSNLVKRVRVCYMSMHVYVLVLSMCVSVCMCVCVSTNI